MEAGREGGRRGGRGGNARRGRPPGTRGAGCGVPDRPHPLLLPPPLPQDQTLRCRVYRIRGAASASNYLQLPPTGSQSLGLTGRYLYVLFRPLPGKHFVIHLDVATEVLRRGGWGTGMGNGGTQQGRVLSPTPIHLSPPDLGPSHRPVLALSAQHAQVIRVSFSNLFKEFKSTATWLQFPLVYGTSTVGEGGEHTRPRRRLQGLVLSHWCQRCPEVLTDLASHRWRGAGPLPMSLDLPAGGPAGYPPHLPQPALQSPQGHAAVCQPAGQERLHQ